MASFHKAIIEINTSYQEAYQILFQAVDLHFKIVSTGKSSGQILAVTGISFLSLGENIQIFITPDRFNSKTRIIISSESRVATTLIDYGINKKNVKKIIDSIDNLLSKNQ